MYLMFGPSLEHQCFLFMKSKVGEMDFIPRPTVRSLDNHQPVRILLKNANDMDVDIIWIDYRGIYQKLLQIPRMCCTNLKTYKTHPLMAVSSITKDPLLMDQKPIFMPETWKEKLTKLHPDTDFDQVFPTHEPCMLVSISRPVYSLRLRTLMCVRALIQCKEDVDSLNLPKKISDDLKELITEKSKYVPPTYEV